ncbi:MAG TPA: DUF4926 domain-containing protein [Allocoleopsis sp.]
MIEPALFDVVELLINLPEKNLVSGMQGTLLEDYGSGNFEVEFTDQNGETIVFCALHKSQFFVVWQSATTTWVKSTDQLISIVTNLSENNQQTIIDFARFLYQKNLIQTSLISSSMNNL